MDSGLVLRGTVIVVATVALALAAVQRWEPAASVPAASPAPASELALPTPSPALAAVPAAEVAEAAAGPGSAVVESESAANAGTEEAAPTAPVASQGEAVEPVAATPAAAVVESVAPPARYAVALGSYLDRDVAVERVETLSARAGSELFMLVPIEVDGRVFHRLLAGLAPDEAGATALSGRLGIVLGEPSATWIVRDLPLAFELARSPVQGVAEALRAEVQALSLPAYILGVEMSDATTEYRVYVGAYADQGESSHMRSLLEARGFQGLTLVERVGRPPSSGLSD